MFEPAIRILHVVGCMDRGGVETWLMQMLRHTDRQRFQNDFLVHTARPCAFDDEIRSLGSRLLHCPAPRNLWSYSASFQSSLLEGRPYDIVHSHVDAFSGFVARFAKQAGVRARIVHSHNDTSRQRRKASGARKCYLALAGRNIRRFATRGLAASPLAARALFGPEWESLNTCKLLYYGCDFEPFACPPNETPVGETPAGKAPASSAEARRELGLDQDDFVVGHVGRFSELKNHSFFIKVAAALARAEPRIRFLLVGDGPLRHEIERDIAARGLQSSFVLTGVRDDIPRLMLAAIDVMLFPSLWEGLPMTMIESQAAGLPVVASTAVPEEAVVLPRLLHRLQLSQPVSFWVKAVLASRGRISSASGRADARKRMRESIFNISTSTASLEDVYQEQAGAARQEAA